MLNTDNDDHAQCDTVKKTRGCRKEVYEIIKKSGQMSLEDLRKRSSANYNTMRSAVISLTNSGAIKRVKRGIYKAL